LGLNLILSSHAAIAQQNGSTPTITINDPGGSAPSVTLRTQVAGTPVGVEVSAGPCGELQRESCDRAGRSFLIAAISYAVVCILLAILLNRILYKRATFGHAGNVVIPVLLFATIATLLMGLDPAKDPNFIACIECGEYREAILLSGLARWPRSVVLGAVPVGLLSLLAILLINKKST